MTTAPTPPPTLPDFIFLLSDHESRQLACDVAQKLYELDSRAVVWDFLSPIHDALIAMHDMDFGIDLGNHTVADATRDEIVSLEKWYVDQYGETTLGQKAYNEAMSTREISDFLIVYRDATWTHLKAFLPYIKPHQFLIINLLPDSSISYNQNPEIQKRTLRFLEPTVDIVVRHILEASK